MFGMCRVCLTCNVKIYLIENSQFLDLYEKLANTKLNTANQACMSICYICFSLLKRCHGFSELARKSTMRLQNVVEQGIVVTEEAIRNMNLGTNHNLSITNLPSLTINVNSGEECAHVTVKKEFIVIEESALDNREEGNTQIPLSTTDGSEECGPIYNQIVEDYLSGLGKPTPVIKKNINKHLLAHRKHNEQVETPQKQTNESLALVDSQSSRNTNKRKLNNGKIDITLDDQPETTNKKDSVIKKTETEPRRKRAVRDCNKSKQQMKKSKIETNETQDSTIIKSSKFTDNTLSSIKSSNKTRKIKDKLEKSKKYLSQLSDQTEVTKIDIKESKPATNKKRKSCKGKIHERKLDLSQLFDHTVATTTATDDKSNKDIHMSEDKKNTKILETLQKLTDLIEEYKPSMFADYNMQCQIVREEKKIDVKKRLPKKRFPWCNRSRALLAQLIQFAGSEQAGIILLDERVLPLFPKGFARMPTLLRMAGCKLSATKAADKKQQNEDVSDLLKLNAEKIPPTYVYKAAFPDQNESLASNSINLPEENKMVLLPYITNTFSLNTDMIGESHEE